MVTCIYRAYANGDLIATGRLTLERLPHVGDEVRLNGRRMSCARSSSAAASTCSSSSPR